MKRHNWYKRGISVVLAAALLASLGGCGEEKQVVIEPMETEEVYTLSFDPIGGKDVMPIAGYYGPIPVEYSYNGESMPDYLSDELFQLIPECGVNLINYCTIDWASQMELAKKLLLQGEKHNVGIFMRDAFVWNDGRSTEITQTVQDYDRRLSEYSDYPAYCGVFVCDEPGSTYYYQQAGPTRYIERYESIFKNLNELGAFGFANLMPVSKKEDLENYDRYVDEWLTTCRPKMVSLDHYVFHNPSSTNIYFRNLDIVRSNAEKHKIPWWNYIAAGMPVPKTEPNEDTESLCADEGRFQWNINTTLALGAKGLEYYTLFGHMGTIETLPGESLPYDFQRSGLIGAWGNKTQWWHYAKNIYKQIAAIDEVLMNASNKGVLIYGEQAEKETKDCDFVIKGSSWRELKSLDGDAMVGCFNYGGKTALYVVNYDTEYAQKIRLDFHNAYKISITQDAKESKMKTKSLTLDMKAGEGALIIFE